MSSSPSWTWDSLTATLQRDYEMSQQPSLFLLNYIRHLRELGWLPHLLPCYSHGTVHLRSREKPQGLYIMLYPPRNNTIDIDVVENKDDAQGLLKFDLGETGTIRELDSIVSRLFSETIE